MDHLSGLGTADHGGNWSTTVYDADGRMLANVDALGHRTSSVYDATGRVIAQQDARGYLTSFVFDAAGRQLAVVDANGHRTSNLYDARGVVQATQDPLGACTTYQFDAAGNTVQRVDARSWPTTYAVDALNRVAGQLHLDGTRVTFTFDGDGRQATMQDVTGVTTLQYDAAGRQTGVTNAIGKALAYSFDAAGNRTVLVDPDGGRTTYAYDAQSRVTGIVNPWNERTTLSYDALDREAQRVLGSGTAVARSYDAAGRETLISSPVAVYTATYDAVGNRTSVMELDGTRVTYSYDPSYQLTREQRSGTSALDESFAYDGLGNRLTKTDASGITTCTYDAANALITSTAPTGVVTTSSYDPSGNLALENAAGALTTYQYDPENRLAGIVNPDGARSTYTYSGTGLRRTAQEPGGAQTLFVWDGDDYLQERAASTVLYVVQDGEVLAEKRSGVRSWYVPDPLGSTSLLLDASLSVTDRFEYWPYGEERVHTGSSATPFRYVGALGYYRDATSRLYVRARVLRPDYGRWLTEDPIGFDGGDWNLCLYAGDRPAMATDPSGLLFDDIWPVSPIVVPDPSIIDPVWAACRCASCASQLFATWNFRWQHRCNHGYMHCMACCLLTRFGDQLSGATSSTGALCAFAAQKAQNLIWRDTANTRRKRLEYCAGGIGNAANTGQQCHYQCIRSHKWKLKDPVCHQHLAEIRRGDGRLRFPRWLCGAYIE